MEPTMTVEIDHIRFAWRPGQSDVLDIARFEVAAGERVFIEGPSGSGKSTLFSLLGGVSHPREGTVRILGAGISEMPARRRDRFRADHIGFVFQMFNLVPYLSMIDNVTLPCRFSRRRHERARLRTGAPDAEARRPDAPRVHDEWNDNLFLTTSVDADIESVRMHAAVVIEREYRTARQCMVPMEGKAVLARYDERKGQLVVYTSTQVPHLIRTGLSQFLGLDQADVRVIAPDVGGGFGYKCVLQPEEISVSWAAMHTGRPLRWVEDRREHLTAGANTRQHHYRLTAFAHERDLSIELLHCPQTRGFGSHIDRACPRSISGRSELIESPSFINAYTSDRMSVRSGLLQPSVCASRRPCHQRIRRHPGGMRHPPSAIRMRQPSSLKPRCMSVRACSGLFLTRSRYTSAAPSSFCSSTWITVLSNGFLWISIRFPLTSGLIFRFGPKSKNSIDPSRRMAQAVPRTPPLSASKIRTSGSLRGEVHNPVKPLCCSCSVVPGASSPMGYTRWMHSVSPALSGKRDSRPPVF